MKAQRLELLAHSHNLQSVLYDPIGSHAATHFKDTPNLKNLARECIQKMTLQGSTIYETVDLGRRIGKTDLVPIRPGDDIVYAKRKNRNIYTVFNKSRRPQPCSAITLVLNQSDTDYILESAWIGHASPPFPGDEYETSYSRQYWSMNALSWGQQEIQEGTETTSCPW